MQWFIIFSTCLALKGVFGDDAYIRAESSESTSAILLPALSLFIAFVHIMSQSCILAIKKNFQTCIIFIIVINNYSKVATKCSSSEENCKTLILNQKLEMLSGKNMLNTNRQQKLGLVCQSVSIEAYPKKKFFKKHESAILMNIKVIR